MLNLPWDRMIFSEVMIRKTFEVDEKSGEEDQMKGGSIELVRA